MADWACPECGMQPHNPDNCRCRKQPNDAEMLDLLLNSPNIYITEAGKEDEKCQK